MKLRQFAGLAMLITVALVIVTGQFFLSEADQPNGPDNPGPANVSLEPVTIKGIAGGKKAFFEDPDVARILEERFGLTVDVQNNIGSIAMIGRCTAADPGNWDFCIPQSRPASETIKANLGSNLYGSEIIANTPFVIYTWAPMVDALIAQNLVELRGDVYYLVDLPRLVQMVGDGTTWEDIGLPQLYGSVSILSSDPLKSSSGNTWAALLASILNDGKVLDESTVDEIGPQLEPFFNRLLSGTSTELFNQMKALGMGAYPLCALYESHLLEYSLQNQTAEHQRFISENIRTLYPEPTVWSEQYVIAMSEGGRRLVTALRDPELQEIGWTKHAFRPSVSSVLIDTEATNLAGLPASIDSVTSLPKPEVMTRLLEILSTEPEGEPEASPDPAASPTAAYRRDELAFRSTG
jgi:hypothetical protein